MQHLTIVDYKNEQLDDICTVLSNSALQPYFCLLYTSIMTQLEEIDKLCVEGETRKFHVVVRRITKEFQPKR